MAKKATNVEIDERVNVVYDLFLRANSRHQIVQYAANAWQVSPRQTDDYIARARQLLSLDAELARPQWLEAALGRLLEYERRASDKDQINTALVALDKQARLLKFEMS